MPATSSGAQSRGQGYSLHGCQCGWYGYDDGLHQCKCTPREVQRYRNKISGPLWDRIDIQVSVPRVSYATLSSKDGSSEPSTAVRERVTRAREVQRARFKRERLPYNAAMGRTQIERWCRLDGESQTLLERAFDRLGFTARSYDRVLKVARTIADLAGEELIKAQHVAEAIQYRILDRREAAAGYGL